MNPSERRELARRRMSLLRYLLRSPFYDAVTKRILARDKIQLKILFALVFG